MKVFSFKNYNNKIFNQNGKKDKSMWFDIDFNYLMLKEKNSLKTWKVEKKAPIGLALSCHDKCRLLMPYKCIKI